MSKLLSAFAFATFVAALPAQRRVFYVDVANGSDANSGTSLAQAWATLQKASTDATKDSTILVMPGTYKPAATVH